MTDEELDKKFTNYKRLMNNIKLTAVTITTCTVAIYAVFQLLRGHNPIKGLAVDSMVMESVMDSNIAIDSSMILETVEETVAEMNVYHAQDNEYTQEQIAR